MKIVRLIGFVIVSLLAAPTFAFDAWGVNDYNGEKVYSSGKATVLLVGKRGVGFATDFSGRYQEAIYISIDSNPPEKYELADVAWGGLVSYIPNSHALAERIMVASMVVLERRNCWTAQCAFSLTGGAGQPIIWAFEKPLAETIKQD